MKLSRRAALKVGSGSLALSTVAGCIGEPDSSSESAHGYAAFFALWDWAERISGDHMEFTNPVDIGEMGHGWEPPSDLQRDIADSEAFVYLDTPEFSWAQDVAGTLETDHDDVVRIDAMAGLENQLLPVDRDTETDREPDTDHEYDPDTVSVAEFEVYDRQSGDEIAYWHIDHWHGSLPQIPLDGYAAVDGVFEDESGRVLPLGEDEPFQFDARVIDGAETGLLDVESQGSHVEFHGTETGRTRVAFELAADGEVVWDTSEDSMTAQVVDELDEGAAPEFYDPHVWIDPIIAQDAVETIAAELAEIDPDGADAYEENAAAYADRLDEVHQQFQALAADAEKDLVVLAGHDAFQYVEHRYGFEIHTPVGISPDAVETASAVSTAIDLVEEHEIDTILYDPFETPNPDDDVPQMVELILENTGADDYAPLTPVEGTTGEWDDRGWGWIEQMEEVNVPSLRNALNAD